MKKTPRATPGPPRARRPSAVRPPSPTTTEPPPDARARARLEGEVAFLERDVAFWRGRVAEAGLRLQHAIQEFLKTSRPGPWGDRAREALAALTHGENSQAADLFREAVRLQVGWYARRGAAHTGRGLDDVTKVIIEAVARRPDITAPELLSHFRDLVGQRHRTVLAVGPAVGVLTPADLKGLPYPLPERAIVWRRQRDMRVNILLYPQFRTACKEARRRFRQRNRRP